MIGSAHVVSVFSSTSSHVTPSMVYVHAHASIGKYDSRLSIVHFPFCTQSILLLFPLEQRWCLSWPVCCF